MLLSGRARVTSGKPRFQENVKGGPSKGVRVNDNIIQRFSTNFYDFLRLSTIFYDFLRFSTIFCDFLRFSMIFYDFLRFSEIFYDFLRFSRISRIF